MTKPLTKTEREELRIEHVPGSGPMKGHCRFCWQRVASSLWPCLVIRLLDAHDAAERRALGWRNAAIIHTNFRRDTGRLVKMRIQGLERDLAAARQDLHGTQMRCSGLLAAARERITAICEALSHKQDHPNPIECAAQAVNEAKQVVEERNTLRDRIAALIRQKEDTATHNRNLYCEWLEERDTLKLRLAAMERKLDMEQIGHAQSVQRIEELERAAEAVCFSATASNVGRLHGLLIGNKLVRKFMATLSSPQPPDAEVKKLDPRNCSCGAMMDGTFDLGGHQPGCDHLIQRRKQCDE